MTHAPRIAGPMSRHFWALVLVMLLAGRAAQADIAKCVDADGNVTYTDAGCPEGTREVEKIPEVVTAEEKKLRPKVPLETRLKRLTDTATYRDLISPYGVLGVYGLMSLICFAVFWRDKRQARQGQWRTPESTLHLLELLGGWPGGLAGQLLLRHKIRKFSYQVVFWIIVGLHGLAWLDVWHQHRFSQAALAFMRRFF